jgi:hypothetical protein
MILQVVKVVVYPERRILEVRRLALGHLDGGDAQAPDVDAEAVVEPADELRRHPVRRPHHRVPLRHLLRQLRTVAKIGCVCVSCACVSCVSCGGACVVSCRVVSCRVVSCRVVPCRAVPCRAVSCRVVSCRVVSCRVVSCRDVS